MEQLWLRHVMVIEHHNPYRLYQKVDPNIIIFLIIIIINNIHNSLPVFSAFGSLIST